MTHSHRTHAKRKQSRNALLLLAVGYLISACSGDSTTIADDVEFAQNRPGIVAEDQGNPNQSALEQAADQAAMTTSGTIIIEERNGKTVFDAFFLHNSEPVVGTSPMANTLGSDICSINALRSDGTPVDPVELGAANGEADYAAVGAALTIESRVGQFEALIKQQVGDLSVYAPEARWRSVPLPEDALLSFDTNSIFAGLGSVELPTLIPLVWLAPETGVMSNPASSLRWEASLDEQTKISLRLSAIDFRDSQNPVVVTVSCDLVDDGLFNLPDKFQRLLPDDDMGIAVYAVRERVREVQVDDSRLTVVQLSYPVPLDP